MYPFNWCAANYIKTAVICAVSHFQGFQDKTVIQGHISILVGLYSNVKLQMYSQVEVEVSNV